MAGEDRIRAELKEILNAFDNEDPPPDRQKALTPGIVRDMLVLSKKLGPVHTHIADLVTGAFFFAMRGCEYSVTERVDEQKTRLLELRDIKLRDKQKRVIPHTDQDIEKKAYYVSVHFEKQKNGKKGDKRTQGRVLDYPDMCPVKAWARVVRRVITTNGEVTDRTQVSQIGDGKGRHTHITNKRVVGLMRLTCRRYGHGKGYGIEPHELGFRSLRSGAAMALFLMNYSPERIMILGRWLSRAFLVYIRPQVMEWTNMMAEDMAKAQDFHDLSKKVRPQHSNMRSNRYDGMMPEFHLHH